MTTPLPQADLPDAPDAPDDPWPRGHSTNFVGVPTGLLASDAFNQSRRALCLAGVRETNHGLFAMLTHAQTADAAAGIFTAYMEVVFGLHPEQRGPAAGTEDGRRRYRSSYVRLLRGWSFDSNGAEAAVLKGWVESRFGLFPTFHKQPIKRFASPAWSRYVEEKMGSRFHNNAILSQLDLIYEFAQWVLGRFRPEVRALRLYRGVNDFAEHPIVARLDRRTVVLRMNNLMSFTSQRDVASCFGDTILEADVPTAKIFFYNDLLHDQTLKGESEVLVIGGDYRVRAVYF